MSRDIKFRAWEKNSEYMIYGVENTYEDKYHGHFYHNFRAILNSQQMDIMQFTGLHDKNGKEIYEGDILKVYDLRGVEPERYCKVYWHENCASFDIDFLKYIEKEKKFIECPNYMWYGRTEVVGNIYETNLEELP